jgi:hypothetical protein
MCELGNLCWPPVSRSPQGVPVEPRPSGSPRRAAIAFAMAWTRSSSCASDCASRLRTSRLNEASPEILVKAMLWVGVKFSDRVGHVSACGVPFAPELIQRMDEISAGNDAVVTTGARHAATVVVFADDARGGKPPVATYPGDDPDGKASRLRARGPARCACHSAARIRFPSMH